MSTVPVRPKRPPLESWYTLFGYLAVLIVLVITTGISYRNALTVFDHAHLVAHTLEVRTELQRSLAAISNSESGQRGFIITGDPIYLNKYGEDIAEARGYVDQLINTTADNPGQRDRAIELRKEVDDKAAEMDGVVTDFRALGFEAAKNRIITGPGKGYMDSIRAQVKSMEEVEGDLLTKRQRNRDASARNAEVAFFTGTGISFVLLTAVYFIVQRSQREQKRQQESLEVEILQRQESQAELDRVNRELQRSNRELQDFAFVASHDLQEPLRKIQAFGERLGTRNREHFDEESVDYLERMQAAAKRMQGLINDILNLSRVTTKGQAFQPVDLNVTLAEVLDDLHARLEETGGTVKSELLPTLMADPVQMHLLLQNLVGNALKFRKSDAPSVINVLPLEAPSRVGFTVADNGIGFDERFADRIFTVFQRLHGRGEYDGSGVGLAICRKIVERHGGQISASSAVGEGATFTVLIPARPLSKEKK